MVETATMLNPKLDKPARRYITDNKKKIDIRGLMVDTVEAEIGQLS